MLLATEILESTATREHMNGWECLCIIGALALVGFMVWCGSRD